jgi:hypothetical protein
VTISWTPPLDNGGQSIISYEVYYKQATQPESSWASIATITDINQLEYTHSGVSSAADVQYKVRAWSGKGDGPFSVRNTFVLASPPTVTAAPTKVSSTRTSITVEWQLASTGGSPITGYRLYSVRVKTGEETLAYDGQHIPTVSSMKVSALREGEYYRFRVAAINRVGEGPKSPLSAQLIAAQRPARSATPQFVSATSSKIRLAFEPTSDNGGSVITSYTLYSTLATDDGASAETYTKVASYTDNSMAFELDNAVETSFVSGKIYRFKFSATNSIGEGEASLSVTIALANPAAKPAAPTLDRAMSTKTSLYIRWLAVTPVDGLAVEGYKLGMVRLGTGDTTVVYDGSANSEKLFFNVTGLETAARYSFTVQSVNANGVSEPSDELLTVVCLPPTGFARATYTSSTRTSITLSWKTVTDNGGCPLLYYKLYMNDGLGGSTFLEIDWPALENKPYLTQHTVTKESTADSSTGGATLTTGRAYRLKLSAHNEVGEVPSTNYVEIVAASAPDAPATPPSQNFASTDIDRIRVEYSSLDTLATNGGSSILGYDLWRDDGAGGDLATIYGERASTQSILALHYTDFSVVKGTTYRYKYRARNINGWGDFSSEAYLFAAGVPSTPRAPSVLAVSDDEISLQLYTPADTGGNEVTAYEL